MTVIGELIKRVLKPGEIIDSVGNALDKLTTSQEEKEAAKLAITQEINRRMEALAGMEFQDVANARDREVSLRNTIGVWVQNLAAAVIIATFMIILFCLIYLKVEVENKELVYTMLGVLGTLVTTLFNYWFGSSAGSAKKADEIQKLMQK